jgi:hypothetical protein
MRRDTHTQLRNPETGDTWAAPNKLVEHYRSKGWTLADSVAESGDAGPYADQTVTQLRDEISTRNTARAAEKAIHPDGAKKADLIAALVADDNTKEL